jgi:hypothetical protein
MRMVHNFALLAAMLGGVVGIGAHQDEGSCPLSNVPDCCEKARSSSKAPEVSMARLCCNLNCSEPGSSGGSGSAGFSSQQTFTPLPTVVPQPLVLRGLLSIRTVGFFICRIPLLSTFKHLSLLI